MLLLLLVTVFCSSDAIFSPKAFGERTLSMEFGVRDWLQILFCRLLSDVSLGNSSHLAVPQFADV